ncbi:DUF3696 domain-containing protein [Idiomarina sp.]|uniref:DUF3696 domain-containing protein n=1 Tax=Idiomarina sp. TaxID=1874361 RepID=UPI003A9128BA
MIKEVELKNFKSYKKEKFSMKNLTLFCGSNSVGKSTVIQSIAGFLQTGNRSPFRLNGELIRLGRKEDIHSFFNVDSDELSIEIVGDDFQVKWGYFDAEGRENTPPQELPLISNQGNEKTPENLIFQYLHAERLGPRDNLVLSESQKGENWLGIQGEYTFEVLSKIRTERRSSLRLSPDEHRMHANSKGNSQVFHNIVLWMSEISPGYGINPETIIEANVSYNSIDIASETSIGVSGHKSRPINIGFGFSYALSVVTALLLAKPGELVILENPEAHLHPKGQSYLGRLIALTSISGVQVIVETHSDHLLNGIRVIFRINDSFDNSEFALYYISQEKSISKAQYISLQDNSALSSWPEGFFDQQALDMYKIATGKDLRDEK